MSRNNSKAARRARAQRALERAKWTLGQYRQGIFRPDQTKNYNPAFSPDKCIEKTELTIKNTERNLSVRYRMGNGPWHIDPDLGTQTHSLQA